MWYVTWYGDTAVSHSDVDVTQTSTRFRDVGFATLGGGKGGGRVGGFGLRGLLRRGHEQVGQFMRNPDQHAGFQQQDAGMQHHTAEIRAAGEDRRRNDEIEQ